MPDMKCDVPAIRLTTLVEAPPNAQGDYVLVWMTAFRRTAYNYTLDRAASWCRHLGKPMLIFEPLRAGYRWNSDRIHRFVMQGMVDNSKACQNAGITYYPYVEPKDGDSRGQLEALGKGAAVVVTDAYPGFFLPRLRIASQKVLQVRTESVDSNGLMPLRASDKAYPSASSYRRIIQREMPKYVLDCPHKALPKDACVKGAKVPPTVLHEWPPADSKLLEATPEALSTLDIDHSVGPASIQGGRKEGLKKLRRLLDDVLSRYAEDRNHPDLDGQSGLSPYFHFGHVSIHELFAALVEREDWHPGRMADKPTGRREGYWGMSAQAEAYIDESVTWRELGLNMAFHRFEDLDRFESLPNWAMESLAEHSHDPRPEIYTLEQLDRAETSDPVWNAAQNQLRREGTLHNYMRMLWGKRVIAWTRTPKEAFLILEHLNNRYGVDGRAPNSYSGILWCFGRYDRPWPSHPIFGKVRMMTSASTQKKLQLKKYLEKYS